MNSQHRYIEEIASFCPQNPQETGDQKAIQWYLEQFGNQALSRENLLGHITSSGFIMNKALDRVLMVHHNIRNTWAWTGGHADGDTDLLAVAIREAKEETGAEHIVPLSTKIASIDILPVYRHVRRGIYVNAHMHLSIAYILLCDEADSLRVKPDENTGVRWFPVADIAEPLFSADDVALYGKLINRARILSKKETAPATDCD